MQMMPVGIDVQERLPVGMVRVKTRVWAVKMAMVRIVAGEMLPVDMTYVGTVSRVSVIARVLVGKMLKTRVWVVMTRVSAGEMLPVGMTYVGAVSRASVIARVLVGKMLKTRVWAVEMMTRVSAGEMLPVNRAFVMTRVGVGEAAAVRVMYKMWPDLYQVMQ